MFRYAIECVVRMLKGVPRSNKDSIIYYEVFPCSPRPMDFVLVRSE